MMLVLHSEVPCLENVLFLFMHSYEMHMSGVNVMQQQSSGLHSLTRWVLTYLLFLGTISTFC